MAEQDPTLNPNNEDQGTTTLNETDQIIQSNNKRQIHEGNTDTTRTEDLVNLRRILQEMDYHPYEKTKPREMILTQSKFFVGQKKIDGQQIPLFVDNPDHLEEFMNIPEWTLQIPDSTWGWLVVLGSFVFMCLIDGICFSYGLLVNEIANYYNLKNNDALAMLPGSLITGMYILTGPFANILANKLNYRHVAIIGSVIATFAIFFSVFMQSFWSFTLFFGLFGGIGFGLIYLPAIAIVGIWFQQRRALAVGLALCGSGIGTLLFAQTTPYCLLSASFHELLIIWAAVSAQCLLAVVTFRPLDIHHAILANEEAEKQEKVKTKKKREIIPKSRIMRRIMEDKKRQLRTSVGSLDGMVITRDNQLISCSPDQYVNPLLSEHAIQRIVNSIMRKQMFLGQQMNTESRRSMTQLVQIYVSQLSLQPAGQPPQAQQQQQQPNEGNPNLAGQSNEILAFDSAVKSEIAREVFREYNRPMFRKDIYYSGSLNAMSHTESMSQIPHVASAPASGSILNDSGQILTSAANGATIETVPGTQAFLRDMFDPQLLISPTFFLLAFACVLSMLGFFVPFHYLPTWVKDGMGLKSAGHVLSAMGLANTLGRMLSTIYIEYNVDGQCSRLDCLWLHNGALIGAGISSLLLAFPYFVNIYTAILFAGMYSLCMAAFISLKSILVVELFGIQRLTNAFSYLLLFQGTCVMLSSPLSIVLKNYFVMNSVPFIFSGICIALSALCHMPLRIVADWERHRLERIYEKENLTNGSKTPNDLESNSANANNAYVGSVSAPLLHSLPSAQFIKPMENNLYANDNMNKAR